MIQIPLIILLLVVLVVLVWGALNYNQLVRIGQQVSESWSNIDTELKRRYDLIPNLVETVKAYAAHERETLAAVIAARDQARNSNGTPSHQAVDEKKFVGSVQKLLAVAEGYPDLKASDNFLALQKELANTEDRIQAARRFYNANVRDINTRIEVFPSNIIASLFKFKSAEFFEVESAVIRQVVDISFNSPGDQT